MQNVSNDATLAAGGISIMAEMVFLDPPPVNFARLVGDMDAALVRLQHKDHLLAWDCEDIAIFDLPGVRIALAYAEAPRNGIAASLTLSVGPSHLPSSQPAKSAPVVAHSVLCSMLVERVQGRLNPNAVFWHETEVLVTADLIDRLTDTEPQARTKHGASHPIYQSPDIGRLGAAPVAPRQGAAQQASAGHALDADLQRLRAALYPEHRA